MLASSLPQERCIESFKTISWATSCTSSSSPPKIFTRFCSRLLRAICLKKNAPLLCYMSLNQNTCVVPAFTSFPYPALPTLLASPTMVFRALYRDDWCRGIPMTRSGRHPVRSHKCSPHSVCSGRSLGRLPPRCARSVRMPRAGDGWCCKTESSPAPWTTPGCSSGKAVAGRVRERTA